MKYIYKTFLITLLVLTFVIFPQHYEPERTLFDPNSIPLKPIEEVILNKMSIEQKVGQLFIFGFDGTTLNTKTQEFFQDTHLGGVLLLSKNINNEKQLIQLTTQIQQTLPIPLFISIDQEGNPVARIEWNETLTKPQSSITTPQQAFNLALSRGEILKGLGINMNLAPVVEYITNTHSFLYDRVYRGNQEEILQKSISSIEGYTEAEIISVPKHYPGHSNTSPDSHYNLPVVNIDRNQWDIYIEPFSKILEQTEVNALMVGHIKYPNIDSKPSTISNEIINERLIETFNYEGIVISDDMEMDALENIDEYSILAKQALLAGNDILIYSKYRNNHPDLQKDVYNYIVGEVNDGNIDLNILNDKVLRILKVKIDYNILEPDITLEKLRKT